MQNQLFVLLCSLWLVALTCACRESNVQTQVQPPPVSQTPVEPAPPPEATPEDAKPTEAEPVKVVQPLTLEQARAMLRAGHTRDVIDGLQLSISKGLIAKGGADAAHYLLGRSMVDEGDPQGLVWLEKLPSPWGDLEDRRLLWLAQAYMLGKRDKEAVAALKSLLSAYPNLPEADKLHLRLARVLHRQGDSTGAMGQLAKVGGSSRGLRAEALLQKMHWTASDEQKRSMARQLLLTFPETEAALSQDLPVRVEELSDKDRMRRARVLIKKWSYGEARRELRRLLDHPKYGEEAAWEVALISLRRLRDDPEEARRLLLRLQKTSPKRREDTYYYLMRSYMKQERYPDALKVADAYERAYPRGKYLERTAYYRGWLPYDRGRCEEALGPMRRYIKKHAKKRSIVMGFYAWCQIRLERWEDAVTAFGRMVPMGNPVVRGKAHYWRAYAMGRLNQRDKGKRELETLHRLYPLSYYDMLGQQMLAMWEGKDPRASKIPWPSGGGDLDVRHPMPIEAWSWPSLKGDSARSFDRVRRLVAIDEVDEARRLYRGVRSSAEDAVAPGKRLDFIRFMGKQVQDYRHGWQTVTSGRLAAMTGKPNPKEVAWALAYPRAYAPLVESLAQEFGVPAHFVYAIMRQESRYNPRAVSHTDAVGALQMIPPTARKVAAEMGIDYDAEAFPRPQVSFRYSFFYLQKHARHFQGQLVPTAASYNGGPEPISRWMRANKGAALPFLIEEFAYNESRIYCRKVAEHTLRYLYLYESDPARRGAWLDALFPVEVNYNIPTEIDY